MFKNLLPRMLVALGCCLVTSIAFSQKAIPRTSVLSLPIDGQVILQKSTKKITAYSNIRSGYVELVAGESIVLEPGFHVAQGASLHARIETAKSDADPESTSGDEIDKAALNLRTHPNPFEAGLEIEYWLPGDTQVSMELVRHVICSTFRSLLV